MSLTPDGFCPTCRHWALECPTFPCPWCRSAGRTRALEVDLGLTADAPVLERLQAAREAIYAARSLEREARWMRTQAARDLLKTETPASAAALSHHRIETLQRWAEPPPPKCPKGHELPLGTRPRSCPVCRVETVIPARKARLRDRNALRASWRRHKSDLAARERLLAQFPDPAPVAARLLPPLPPPGYHGDEAS